MKKRLTCLALTLALVFTLFLPVAQAGTVNYTYRIVTQYNYNQLHKPISHTIRLTVYLVRSGDTLEQIAARYGTTVEEIIKINKLKSTILKKGQVLIIKRGQAPAPGDAVPDPKPPTDDPAPVPPVDKPEPPVDKPEPPVPDPEPSPPQNSQLTADEQLMLNLVNQERTKYGLKPLQIDMELVKLARLKSQDMVNLGYFSHQSPTYGSPFDMMKAAGIRYTRAGENLAGNPSVQGAHTSLMNSSGHRANILNAQYTHVGIGVINGSRYGKIFTQMFIQKP